MAQSAAADGGLGSSLEVRNPVVKELVEYFVGLKRYRQAEGGSSNVPSDPLMELVLLSPTRSLLFIRSSIMFSIFVSFMLFLPELVISKFDHVCPKCIKLLAVWLYVYRTIVVSQFLLRVLFHYIFAQLTDKSNQEIIYCMSVITTGRGWNVSRHLTSFSYFWYGLGMVLHRFPNMCNKRWLYALIFYILSANVLRFAFTVVLYYYTFPPTHEMAKKINRRYSLPLPKLSFEEARGGAVGLKSTACGICLDDFQGPDQLRVLGCSHGFHVNCIDLWLSRSIQCPLCMKSLI